MATAVERHDWLAHRFCKLPESEVSVSLAQLGTSGCSRNRGDSLLRDGLIDRYHFLGHAPLCGAQIRYLIHADRGVIGAIGFGATAFALQARERWTSAGTGAPAR